MTTYRADVATDAPARYAKQLVSHLGRKVAFETSADGATSTATIGDARGAVVVGEGVLTLLVEGPDDAGTETARAVLGTHLERFGERAGLQVTWTRSIAAA